MPLEAIRLARQVSGAFVVYPQVDRVISWVYLSTCLWVGLEGSAETRDEKGGEEKKSKQAELIRVSLVSG